MSGQARPPAPVCEAYLMSTMDRCGEPALFHVTSRIPEVAEQETEAGTFCFHHAMQLAELLLDDGRPEFRITLLPSA